MENIVNIWKKGVSELYLFSHLTYAKHLLCSGLSVLEVAYSMN